MCVYVCLFGIVSVSAEMGLLTSYNLPRFLMMSTNNSQW